MKQDPEKTGKIRNELIKITRTWAAGREIDLEQARELRGEAILLNHTHYLESIPVYQKLARDEGIGKTTDIDTIQRKFVLYRQHFQELRTGMARPA
jgi:hypothetical protein